MMFSSYTMNLMKKMNLMRNFLSQTSVLGKVPPSWLPGKPNLEWIQLVSVGFGEYLETPKFGEKIFTADSYDQSSRGFFQNQLGQSMLAGLLAIYRGIDQIYFAQGVSEMGGRSNT
ncbi:MAG: hypothetical protein CM1200mP30_02650 [Pseudomonadota bacterium]|nr:MAG: hypothetical protein CM1200mP30_02650 [Pseudomonadota bacterium]